METKRVILLMACFLSFTLYTQAFSQMEYHPGETYIILADGTTRLYDPNVDYSKLKLNPPRKGKGYHPLPKDFLERMKARGIKTSTFNVTYNNFTPDAQAAFQYAVDIWQSIVNSSVPINTYASWEPMGAGVLGSSQLMGAYRNFTGAPLSNVWYHVTTAEAISGTNLNGTGWDIYVRFNSDFDWYLGTDGKPSGGLYDFVSIVLHELCHGLGFYTSFKYTSGVGQWGYSGYPYITDTYTENGDWQSLINTAIFPNNSTALGAQITSNNVFFNGPNAVQNYNNERGSIYAPSVWNGGSSMSHVGEEFNGTRNSLMTYSAAPGESEHAAGPVTIGWLRDMGWTIPNIPPILDPPIADDSIAQNSSKLLYCYLPKYFFDPDAYAVTSYAATSSGNIIVTIQNDSLYITPQPGFVGWDTIYITGTDEGGLSVSDTFCVKVKTIHPAVNGVMYTAGTAGSGSLYALNTNTSELTLIGPTTYSTVVGLTYRQSDHKIFGAFITGGSTTYICQVNSEDGDAYEYVQTPLSNVKAIEMDLDDNLYAAQLNGTLWKINLSTGDTIRIGSTGIANLYGLAINPITNQLWGYNSGGSLYRINKETAASELVGDNAYTNCRDIAFTSGGDLYALATAGNKLIELDTTNASATLIGTSTGTTGLNALMIYGNPPVGVSEGTTGMPKEYNLYACYPNPFNPSTTIAYDLPRASRVELKIYNLLGQEVRTLVNATKNAGRQTVVWDGRNDAGDAVSSGIYIYRIVTPGFTKSMKMMLIK